MKQTISLLITVVLSVLSCRREAAPTASPSTPPTSPTSPTSPGLRTQSPSEPCDERAKVRLVHVGPPAPGAMRLSAAVAQDPACQHGLNLSVVRVDDLEAAQEALMTFAEAQGRGQPPPASGAQLAAITVDQAVTALPRLNARLSALGPDHRAVVVGSLGVAPGADALLGPRAWKDNPLRARGKVIAGAPTASSTRVAMKWLAEHGLKSNWREDVHDPDAVNWVKATDDLDAAQKYVGRYCATVPNLKTRRSEPRCVAGAATSAPGDALIAEKRGGLVQLASTSEPSRQLFIVLIGDARWMSQNRATVKALLAASFSGTSSLAENLKLFGLKHGARSAFAARFNELGDLIRQHQPDLLENLEPASKVFDHTFLVELANARANPTDDVAPWN